MCFPLVFIEDQALLAFAKENVATLENSKYRQHWMESFQRAKHIGQYLIVFLMSQECILFPRGYREAVPRWIEVGLSL